jgi:serine/threonine protein kinase
VYKHGLERFIDEARSMARFSSHRNIIKVSGYFEENNTAYIVMEHLEGITLNEFLKTNRMDYQGSIEIIGHVCGALKDIHRAGIIHRDVSPDNIFICDNRIITLIDFGAARFSSEKEQQPVIILKPGFAPPEQYERVNVQGPRTDIYALGATLYYMLTGVKPTESTNRIISDTVPAPHELNSSVPVAVSNSVMRAMAIDKNLRFASVYDFEKAIIEEKPVPPIGILKRRRQLRQIASLASAFLIVILSSVMLFANWNTQGVQETLAPATITIAFPHDEEKIAAFENIISAFRENFSNINIEIITFPARGYENAITGGNLPTLFESTGFGNLESTADLSAVAERLSRREFRFYDHLTSVTELNQLPLGFNVPVIYENSTFGEYLQTPRKDLFLSEQAGVYISDTSDFFEIQAALPGRYSISHVDIERPHFTDFFSINANASPAERAAAERFLRYLFGSNAQDILHIRNRSGSLPVNSDMLDEFTNVHEEFLIYFRLIGG